MKTALVLAILGVLVVVAGVGYFDMAGSSMNVVIMAFGFALLVAAAVRGRYVHVKRSDG